MAKKKHIHYWKLIATSRAGATSECKCGATKRDTPEGELTIWNAKHQMTYRGRRPQKVAQ